MRSNFQSIEEFLNSFTFSEHQLLLVEGIPGSGKTTTAHRIKEKLESHGIAVELYTEGDSHPADMAWQAYMTLEQYEEFKRKCKALWESSKKDIMLEELFNRIEKQVRYDDGHVLLAYTKIEFPEEKYWTLVGSVAPYELGSGRSSLEDFTNIHLKRWKSFADEKSPNSIAIFECAFLQNHVVELMGHYEKPDEEILTYFRNLLQTVKPLKPKLVYLYPQDIGSVISNAAKERKAPEGIQQPDWIDAFIKWVEDCSYGKTHKLEGFDGAIAFCQERLRLDEFIMNNIELDADIINRT